MNFQQSNTWLWAAIAAGVNGWHPTSVLAIAAGIRRSNESHRP